jgi:tetratricopeptide (TPR) repeat protein
VDWKTQKRQQRRTRIHQAWEEHYEALVAGEISLGEILGYDDQKLMKLADKGLRLYKLGKLRAARRVFRGLVVLDPWVPYFHYLLGTVHEKLSELPAAEREYAKVIELASQLEPPPELLGFALLAQGRMLGRLGRIAEALETLASVLEQQERIDPVVLNTARLIAEHLQAQRPGS